MTTHPNRSQKRRQLFLDALTCGVHQSEMDYTGQQIFAAAQELYRRDRAFRREVDEINIARNEEWEIARLEAGLPPR